MPWSALLCRAIHSPLAYNIFRAAYLSRFGFVAPTLGWAVLYDVGLGKYLFDFHGDTASLYTRFYNRARSSFEPDKGKPRAGWAGLG